MQTNSDYILVDNHRSLELALINLKQANVLSIDTESSGYYTYYPKVCLLQIHAKGKTYLIDPIKISNISSLSTFFLDPQKLKIFHSAQDDIRGLNRDFGFRFANIADTLIGSRLLALGQNSLFYLVEKYHQIKLSKVEQKSNWEIRPLQVQQLRYAALDTVYLESIWKSMEEELASKHLLDEALSEFDFLSKEHYIPKESEGFQLVRFPNIIDFTPLERRKILELLRYRDERARKINKASFRIWPNERISQCVKEEPKLNKCIEWFGKKDGEEVFKILTSEYSDPIEASELTKRKGEDLDESESFQFLQLKKWRTRVMRVRRMEHHLLPSNRQLIEIIRKQPKSIDELGSMTLFSDWKLSNYGPGILAAIQNQDIEKTLKGLIPIRTKEEFALKKQKNTIE